MKRSAWLLAGAWMVVIFVLAEVTVLPQNHDASRFYLRKALHLGIYAVLGALVGRALASRRRNWLARAPLALAVVALVGGVDELIQLFVPGRSSRLADVELDVVGGVLGFAGAWMLDTLTRALRRPTGTVPAPAHADREASVAGQTILRP